MRTALHRTQRLSKLIATLCCIAAAGSCIDNDRSVAVTASSIQIEEDSEFFSGGNLYDWRAPGGTARVSLAVRTFNNGSVRVSIFDPLGFPLFARTYRTFDYYFRHGGLGYYYARDDDFFDLAFTDRGDPGLWTIEVDSWRFTGEVRLLVEDTASAAPTTRTPTTSAATAPLRIAPLQAAAPPPSPRRHPQCQDDQGRRYAVGTWLSSGGTRHLAVSRYGPSGELDTSFGTRGQFVFDGSIESAGLDAVLDRDGIVIAGWAAESHQDLDALVVRLDATGQLDASFGDDGFVRLDLGQDEVGVAITNSDDESRHLVVGGVTQDLGADRSAAIAFRIRAVDGQPDRSFGQHDGVYRADRLHTRACDVGVDPAGRIVLLGVMGDSAAAWRLSQDGTSLDAEATSPSTPSRIAHAIEHLDLTTLTYSGVAWREADDADASPQPILEQLHWTTPERRLNPVLDAPHAAPPSVPAETIKPAKATAGSVEVAREGELPR